MGDRGGEPVGRTRRRPTRRRWWEGLLAIVAGVAISAAVIVFPLWKSAVDRARSRQSAEPFRIAGNLYYVGLNDITAFLLTGPAGHVLIDGGDPTTAPMIAASIATLGFDMRDVKMLVNSEPLFEHAGGLAALQQASGAELSVSDASAQAIASGGADDLNVPLKFLVGLGLHRYAAARVDHRFKEGATIRLGPIALTAHITGGHTRGCTSWSFRVRDGDRELYVVRVCDLTVLPGRSLVEPESYPGIRADFERSFRVLRSLPVDIFLTAHAREFGRYRKFLERDKARNPVDPFIDHEGYVRYLDGAEAKFRTLVAAQQRRTSRIGSTLAGAASRWGWQ